MVHQQRWWSSLAKAISPSSMPWRRTKEVSLAPSGASPNDDPSVPINSMAIRGSALHKLVSSGF
jgi:hypothetical protein